MDARGRHALAQRLDGAAWGLFLAWVGACLLVGAAWSTAVLGVAATILGFQVVRAATRVGVEWFWVLVGASFAASAVLDRADLHVPYFPILMIVVGAAIAVTALSGHRRHRLQ